MSDLLDRQDFVIDPNLMETRVADERILLHPVSGEYFGVDGLGARVFDTLRNGASLRDLAGAVAAESKVGLDVVQNDFRDYLTELLDAGIVYLP